MKDFGVFKEIFDERMFYLNFVHLHPSDSKVFNAVDTLKNIISECENPEISIIQLLDEGGWRPHIVAVTSLLFLEEASGNVLERLWDVFDSYSWTSSQLAVVLSIHDQDFEANALRRIANECSSLSKLPSLSAEGKPLGNYLRRCKNVSSLASMIEEKKMCLNLSEAERLQIKQMISDDRDRGNEIASDWLKSVRENTQFRVKNL